MKINRLPAVLIAACSLLILPGCLPQEESKGEIMEESDLTIAMIGGFKLQDTTDPITAQKSTGSML